ETAKWNPAHQIQFFNDIVYVDPSTLGNAIVDQPLDGKSNNATTSTVFREPPRWVFNISAVIYEKASTSLTHSSVNRVVDFFTSDPVEEANFKERSAMFATSLIANVTIPAIRFTHYIPPVYSNLKQVNFTNDSILVTLDAGERSDSLGWFTLGNIPIPKSLNV